MTPHFLRAAALAVAMTALAAPTASALPSAGWFDASSITTPADLTPVAVGDAPATLAVSGSVNGATTGAWGRVACVHAEPDADGELLVPAVVDLATNVPVADDGTFAVDVPAWSVPPAPCRLRFLPAGVNDNLGAYSGPRVVRRRLHDAVTGETAASPGVLYDRDADFGPDDFSARFSIESAGACGVFWTALNDDGPADPLPGPTTLECGVEYARTADDPAVVAAGRSEVQVDGVDAFLPGSLPNAEDWSGLPALTTSFTRDASTGEVRWEESAKVVRCEHPGFPATAAGCGALLPTGVRFERVVTSERHGAVVLVRDRWVSADGHAHALDLLPEFELAAGPRSGIRLPWVGTEFIQYAADPSAPGPGESGPGSFYTRPDRLAAGVLGPTTAITFSDAPDRIEWHGKIWDQSPNGAVQPAYVRTVPAGGAYAQAWAISTAASVDGAEALAAEAEERFTPPAGPDPVPTPAPAPPASGPGATPPPAVTPGPSCRVPRLRGMRLAAGRAALTTAHCRLGSVKRRRVAASSGVRRGRIARQSLPAGTVRPAGTAVGVTVRKRRLRAAAAATAAGGPSVRPDSRLVSRGDRYTLAGRGWGTGGGCEPRIRISQTFGHGVPVGSARIRDDGTFTFSRRIPRATEAGTRLRFDATQFCDGIGTTRSATVRVGRAVHGCQGPLVVGGEAYDLRIWAGLTCATGADAIGPFLDTHIDPDGFSCAHVDPATGHDAVCTKQANPASRVTARHVSEV
jgi:hypothetical protein